MCREQTVVLMWHAYMHLVSSLQGRLVSEEALVPQPPRAELATIASTDAQSTAKATSGEGISGPGDSDLLRRVFRSPAFQAVLNVTALR